MSPTGLCPVEWNRLASGHPSPTSGSDSFSVSVSVKPLNCVWFLANPWTAARQASLSTPTPRVYSNSCPLCWWCHPTISSSVVPFSSRFQSFPALGSLQMSHLDSVKSDTCSNTQWEAWCAAIHGVAKSRTRLSDWTELNWDRPLVSYFSLGGQIFPSYISFSLVSSETWKFCRQDTKIIWDQIIMPKAYSFIRE